MTKTQNMTLRLSPEDAETIERAAAAARVSASEYMRSATIDRAEGYAVDLDERERAIIDGAVRRAEILGEGDEIAPTVRRAHISAWAVACARVSTHETPASVQLARYHSLMRASRPSLSREEWRWVCDVQNGGMGWMGGLEASMGREGAAELAVRGLALELADSLALEGGPLGYAGTRAAAHGLTREQAEGLVERVRGMRLDELTAIAHAVEQWWSREPRSTVGPTPAEEGWTED